MSTASDSRLDVRFPSEPCVSGTLIGLGTADPALPLLVCIHGGGCNSRYFDIRGHSTLDAARRYGFPILLIDRPGHAGNPPIGALPIAGSILSMHDLIDRVVNRHAPGRRVFLLGHSIGAAVALMLAAGRRDWTLSGIAVSGLGDEPPARVWTSVGGFSSGALSVNDFLGPDGSWSWNVLPRLRRVSEPWIAEELLEIRTQWPRRWPGLAAAIDVPVHLRLADHEAIWLTGGAVVARMAAALTRSPRIDAALLEEGGHLYELHKRGPELIAAQLAFAASTR